MTATRYRSAVARTSADLRVGPTEQAQRDQADEHVVEVAGEPLERRPLAVGAVLGVLADEDHEHRDQRDGQRQDQRRQRVGDQDPGPGDERHDHGEAQRRQVGADPRVERVDATW